MCPAQRARDRVKADRRHALLGERRHELRIDERLQQPDDNLALAQRVDVRVVGLLDADDRVGLAVHLVARSQLGAGIGKRLIRNGRAVASTALDQDFRPCGEKWFQRIRHERDAPLIGRALFYETDFHERPLGKCWGSGRKNSLPQGSASNRLSEGLR